MPILHHHEISQLFDLQDGGRPTAWIYKIEIEIFNSCVLYRHALHQPVKFYADWSYRCRDTAIFFFYMVKCKNSLNDRT